MLLPRKGQTYLIRMLTGCDLGSLLSPGIHKDSQATYHTAVSYNEQSGDRWGQGRQQVQHARGIQNCSLGSMQTFPDLPVLELKDGRGQKSPHSRPHPYPSPITA